MIGIDGDQIGPLARNYARRGDEALLDMMHEWARSVVQTGAGGQPAWSIGQEAAMLAMRDAAPHSSSLPLMRVVESFNRIAQPLADYVSERFPGMSESYDAWSTAYPANCSGYRGSLPRPEQRKVLATQIIQVLGT